MPLQIQRVCILLYCLVSLEIDVRENLQDIMHRLNREWTGIQSNTCFNINLETNSNVY